MHTTAPGRQGVRQHSLQSQRMRMLFPSTVNEKRFHMGWLQLRRWLSFLPAAFVVYILLHYLVYQPDISGPHAVLVTDGRSNSSLVGGAGGRTLQSGPRVLPHLSSDSQDVLQDAPNAPANAATPSAGLEDSAASPGVAASAAGSGHLQPEDNTTAFQAQPSEGNNKAPASPQEKGTQPQAKGVAGHTEVRVSSTMRAVSSLSSSSVATKGAGLPQQSSSAGLAAAQSQPQPPHMVVVEGTGSVPQVRQAKKTTVVKKSNIASSTGLSINALKGRTKVGEKYESGFNVPHEELCPNNGRELKVLVLITTAPDHEKHRTAVRQTWGHFSIRKDVVMAFMIGRTNNPTIQANIDRENELYGDVVQANFIDHYSNLTLKTVSMFEWAKTYCSESHFILKTDDDMFINMPLLLTFIDSKINDRRVMYGRLAKGWKPVRNKKSKYYIDTSTYSKTRYPDFLTGPAYLFTNDVVDDIYQKALGTTFFVLEDVLVTGIVGESLRIKRVGDSRFRNEKIKLTDTCSLMKTISIHMVKYEEQFDIYKRTLDGKAKCKTG